MITSFLCGIFQDLWGFFKVKYLQKNLQILKTTILYGEYNTNKLLKQNE